VIHTPRLTLRPIAEADTDAIVALFADPELSRFHAHNLADETEARAWVARRLAYLGPPGTGEWVFVLHNEIVGVGRLTPSTELPGGVLETGFYLARHHWGTGLATEAVSALLRHAFHTLGAPAVFALVHEDNHRSHTMATRLGFLDVGSGQHYHATHRIMLALPERAGLHHVEIWVPTVAQARRTWGWLLTELGWHEYQTWDNGISYRLAHTYIVFEDSPARSARLHERLRPGLNHIALHAGHPDRIEEIVKSAPDHGWQLMFADRHPYAGGPDHYAAYLENVDGYEVELVATDVR
jgi:RimJ/RimL family protein N-acetyltransferase/catechol 2,3-dioxygenase-like lactoylglutathione lyase family enzyme